MEEPNITDLLELVKDHGNFDFDEFDSKLEQLIEDSSYLIKLQVAGTEMDRYEEFFLNSKNFINAVVSLTIYNHDTVLGSDIRYNQKDTDAPMPRQVQWRINALIYELDQYKAKLEADTNGNG